MQGSVCTSLLLLFKLVESPKRKFMSWVPCQAFEVATVITSPPPLSTSGHKCFLFCYKIQHCVFKLLYIQRSFFIKAGNNHVIPTVVVLLVQLSELLRFIASDKSHLHSCLFLVFFCQLSIPRASRSYSVLSRHLCLALPLGLSQFITLV